jgi:hypothetical protein
MAHPHRLSDHEPDKATDVIPASAAQIFLLIELVRPISALAELILARQAKQEAEPEMQPAPPRPPKGKKTSVAATLDAIGSLDDE